MESVLVSALIGCFLLVLVPAALLPFLLADESDAVPAPAPRALAPVVARDAAHGAETLAA